MFTSFVTGMVGGLLGSAHCLGMCGGFAACLGATEIPFWPSFRRHLTYNVGRTFTYCFLGAMSGALGTYLSQYQGSLVTAQQVFSIIAGVFMVLVGLSVLGLFRVQWLKLPGLTELFAPAFKSCLNARSLPGFFAAGMANGFLPCGLVYAFLAMAVGHGTLAGGAVLMAGFGLGTIPAMLSIGCGAKLISHTARLQVFRIAACFVLVLGVVTIARGVPREAPNSCHTPVQQAQK